MTETEERLNTVMSYAKGRIKKWARSITRGVDFSIDDKPYKTSDGFTAEMINGATVYAWGNRFAFKKPGEQVVNGPLRNIRNVIQMVLGLDRKFEIGESMVDMSIAYVPTHNKIYLGLLLKVPNPTAEWEADRFSSRYYRVTNPAVVQMAIGVMAEREPDPTGVMAMLDMVRELDLKLEEFDDMADRLLATKVPDERLKAWRYDFVCDTHPEYAGRNYTRKRVEWVTGGPVEGPDGEWRERGW